MRFKPTVLFASMVAAGAIATTPALAGYGGKLGCVRNPNMEYMQSVVDRNATGLKNVDPCFVKSWYDRIRVSGMINVDGEFSGKFNSNSAYQTSEATGRYSTGHWGSDIVLNNASLFVDAMVASWVNAHLALDWHSLDNALPTPTTNAALVGPDPATSLNLEEGFVTLGDLSRWPVYARLGKQYINYGHYTLHPMTQTFTQLLTQTNKVAATLGFVVPMGFYGSIYAFRGADKVNAAATTVTRRSIDNYGAQLGYGMQNPTYGFNVQGGYMRNISDVQYIQYNILSPNILGVTATPITGTQGAYVRQVGGWAVSGNGNYGPFDGTVAWTTAAQRFPTASIAFGGSGARPYAMDFDAGYSFKLMGYDSRLGFSYQFSKKASGLVIPRDRYLGEYRVNVAKFTDLGVQVYHDRDYARSKGGSNGNATVGKVRVAVAFA